MPGKIGRQHAKSVMGEGAGQQRPDGMVHAGAVQKDHARQRRVEIRARRWRRNVSMPIDRRMRIA